MASAEGFDNVVFFQPAVSITTNKSDVICNACRTSDAYPSLGALESLNYNLPVMLVVAGILVVVMATTAFGNFLVGLSLVRYRSLQTVSNYLIGNLAASDFLLATTVLPLSTVDECLGRWVMGQAMCNLWLVADVMYCTASIWNLLVIAFDRYTATMFPLWYRERRSAKQAGVYVALVWVVATATCVPPLLGWNSLSQNYVYRNETSSYHCVLFQTPSYVIYSACVSFYLPFLLTFFLYVRIFFVLRKRIRRMRETAETKRTALAAIRSVPNVIRPSILDDTRSPPELEMRTRLSETVEGNPAGSGKMDDSTSRSPVTSDSDDLEEFEESCTITTINSPSTPLFSIPLPTSPALPSTPHPVVALSSPAERNGYELFYLEAKSEGEGEQSTDVRIPPHLEEKGHSQPSMNFLSPTICVFDQRWKASSFHLQHGQEKKNPRRKIPGKRSRVNGHAKVPSARRGGRRPADGGTRPRSAGRYDRREMRATVRMSAIIGVFCGMWIGFFSVYVVKGLCTDCSVPRPLEAFFFWMGYTNSAINPVLYTIFNEEFRKAFQKTLGCLPKKSVAMTTG